MLNEMFAFAAFLEALRKKNQNWGVSGLAGERCRTEMSNFLT